MTDSFTPERFDFVWHGVVTLVGLAVLAMSSPVWVPLYVIGRVSHRYWPIEPVDSDSVDLWH